MLSKKEKELRKVIFPHSGLFYPGKVFHNEDRDANVDFGLRISVWRVEREKDKKVVPCWVEIHWWFWTWKQKITIFL